MVKNYYNTILSQTFSPCGKYLVAGDIYGDITIFDLQKLVNPDTTLEQNKPKGKFTINKDVQNCCLVTTENFMICGSIGEISGWNWNTVLSSSKNAKPAWVIQIPSSKDSLEKTDVNCMLYDKARGTLYAGCGDNNIYAFSLEDGKLVQTFESHDDYIHDIKKQENQLVSASEDGTVRLWDLRDKTVTNKIAPHTIDKVARSHLGKWIGAVDISDYWLVCGGGPSLALFHLHSLDVTTVFNTNDKGVHIAQFNDDRIIAGGSSKYLYQFSFNGEVSAEIPSSSVSIYSVIHQEEPFKVMSIAGSSPHIDICTNFSYRDQVFSV